MIFSIVTNYIQAYVQTVSALINIKEVRRIALEAKAKKEQAETENNTDIRNTEKGNDNEGLVKTNMQKQVCSSFSNIELILLYDVFKFFT